jgi:nitroreductase
MAGTNDSARLFATALAGRDSCRAFRPEPVPRALIETMIAIAQLSPSWCNSQPWQVMVLKGVAAARLRTTLQDAANDAPTPDYAFPASYSGDYNTRRKVTAMKVYQAVRVAHGDRDASNRQTARNSDLLDAPFAMLVTALAELRIYGAVDCGVFVANLLTAAQTLGIATIAQATLAMCSAVLHDVFEIPADRRIVCGISLGYADEVDPANSFRTTRAATEAVIEWRN